MIRLQNEVYAVAPDLSEVLGFSVTRATALGQIWDVGESRAGGCRLVSSTRDVDAEIVAGRRCMPFFLLAGLRLHVPGELWHTSLMGALVVQDGRAVGVVQAMPGDIWGFPLPLLDRMGLRREFPVRNPLLVAGDFSLSYNACIDPDELIMPTITAAGLHIRNPLRRLDAEFDDSRCLYIAGAIISSAGLVVSVLPDAAAFFRPGAHVDVVNEVKNPTFDALLHLIEGSSPITIVADDDAFRAQELPAVVVPPFAIPVRRGAYIWGFCDKNDDLIWRPSKVIEPVAMVEEPLPAPISEGEEGEEEEIAPAPERSDSPCDFYESE